MKDNRLTNILLIVLIVLVGLSFFRPSLDGAQTAQAKPSMQEQDITDGEVAIASAQREIAKANTLISKSIDKHGLKLLESAKLIAASIEKAAKK